MEEVKERIKKWDHIAVRPITFQEFRRLRGFSQPSDDSFVRVLLKLYSSYLNKKRMEAKNVQPKEIGQ